MSSTGSITDSDGTGTGATFRALRRAIVRSRGFSILLCVCDSPAHGDELIDNLSASTPALNIRRIDLEADAEDTLEVVSGKLGGTAGEAIMVTGLWRAFDRPEQRDRLLDTLNLRRGEWPGRVPLPVVFWIPRAHLGPLLRGAPDFFDWRSDTLEFPTHIDESVFRRLGERQWSFGVDPRLSAADQRDRVLELRSRLARSEGTDSEAIERSRLRWWDELAELLAFRGDLDEALRIRTEEQLPVFERLGAMRDLAIARTNTAILEIARDHPGDRLRARQHLVVALEEARKLGIPEAGVIQQHLHALDASERRESADD